METNDGYVLAVFELVAYPEHTVAVDLRVASEPADATVASQQGPASSLCNREREGVGSREFLPIASESSGPAKLVG